METLLSRGVGACVWAKGREWLMCITVQKPWENHQQTNTPGILEPTPAVEPLSYTKAGCLQPALKKENNTTSKTEEEQTVLPTLLPK